MAKPSRAARLEHQSFLIRSRSTRVRFRTTSEDLAEAIARPPKLAERQQLESDLETFLARGGKITEVPTGVSGRTR